MKNSVLALVLGACVVGAQTIPANSAIHVRLDQTVDTRTNHSGDRFFATLTAPVQAEGRTVIPKGARFSGHVVESKPSGRFKGRAALSLSLDSFEMNGQRYEVNTTRVARASGRHKKRNWALIGGGAGVGAALGAIAGGPAALIGAGAGAAAGTTVAAFTGKKNVHLAVETPLTFSLRSPLALTGANSHTE
jgi:hypothetical protein